MFSNAVCRGMTRVLRSSQVGNATKCFVATIHTSAPSCDALGEIIQRLRFRYYRDPNHHLKYDKWAKIFTVEGNIKSGKGEFAEEFAKRKDLRFFPSADYSYIISSKERLLPKEEVEFLMDEERIFKRALNVSLDRVYTNPEDWAQMARYQLAMMKARFYQYADAMAHLIRTGQGVVIERSFFSLPIFEHAFKTMKWQNKEVLNHLYAYRMNMAQKFLRPQVVLYLDVPPEQCLENIKKSGNPAEQHIPLEYLKAMDEGYSSYLREADRFGSKVIEFDWSTNRDMDEAMMTLDDVPLLHEYNHWDRSNRELKKMMRDFSDEFNLYKMTFMYIPMDELRPPAWTYYADPLYQQSRPWWRPGYDPKKVKWLWLKEPDYKKDGFIA